MPAVRTAPAPDSSTQTLEIERRCFEEHRQQLVKEHLGQFALVRGSAIIGVFPDASAALAKARQDFGVQEVLIKRISQNDAILVSPLLTKRAHP